jgi:ribosomal protein S18 acetylase RimI-like enzyme
MSEQVPEPLAPPTLGFMIRSLEPEQEETAAALLAACTYEGTVERGRGLLASLRAEPDTELIGLVDHGDLVAVFVTRKALMSLEVLYLTVGPAYRRQGYGRACLQDALRRAGKRPLVAETDDEGLPFYQACGFKLIGRRKHPNGTVRYRLGWHAPRTGPATPARPPGDQ